MCFAFSVDRSVVGAGKCISEGHALESESIPYVPVSENEEETTQKQSENVAPNVIIANSWLPNLTQKEFSCLVHKNATNTHGSVLSARLSNDTQPAEVISDFTGIPTTTRDILSLTVNSAGGSSYECGQDIPSGNNFYSFTSPIQQMQRPIFPTHSNLTTSDASPECKSTISRHFQGICLSPTNCSSLQTNYPPTPGCMSSTCQPQLSAEQSASKVLPLGQNDNLIGDMLLEPLTQTTSASCHVRIPVTCLASLDVTTNTSHSYHYPTPNITFPPTDPLFEDIHSTFSPEEQTTNTSSNSSGTQSQSASAAAVSHGCMTSPLQFNPFESSIDQIIDELLVKTSSDNDAYPDLPVHDQSLTNSN